MVTDESNSISIIDNTIITSLMHFYTDIRLINGIEGPYFCLKVIDNDRNKREYSFYTLEEAVYLKNRLKKCKTLEDVDKLYKNLLLVDGEYIKPTSPVKIEDNRAFLTEKEIKNAIIDYYNRGNNRITVNRRAVYRNKRWTQRFYATSHYDLDGENRVHRRLLTPENLRLVFEELFENEDYELVDYNFINESHNIAYAPYFHGVELQVKQREKPMRLDFTKQYGY